MDYITDERKDFEEHVQYTRQILYTVKPKILEENDDMEAVKRENKRQYNTAAQYVMPMIVDLEQRRVRNTLRFLGIPEDPNEDTKATIMNSLRSINIHTQRKNYYSCYRHGEATPTALVVTFSNRDIIRHILRRKSVARTYGITVFEELCQERSEIRRLAVDRFGSRNVSVETGIIVINLQNGNSRQVRTLVEYSNLIAEM